MPNSRSLFDFSRSRTSGNERTGQSYIENVDYNCTLTYGTCESFGSVYLFFVNIYDRSYFSGSTNQISDKRIRWSNHSIQTCDRYKTLSITFTPVIFYMCCTESYCTRWQKGIKFLSPRAKGFYGIFVGIRQHQKGYLVYVSGTRKILSSYDFFLIQYFPVR